MLASDLPKSLLNTDKKSGDAMKPSPPSRTLTRISCLSPYLPLCSMQHFRRLIMRICASAILEQIINGIKLMLVVILVLSVANDHYSVPGYKMNNQGSSHSRGEVCSPLTCQTHYDYSFMECNTT